MRERERQADRKVKEGYRGETADRETDRRSRQINRYIDCSVEVRQMVKKQVR